MDKQYSFAPDLIAIPDNSGASERGRHLVQIKGCADCHGEGLGGKIMVDDGAVGRIAASNLTRGTGGLPADYRTADCMKALRHGIARNGRPILLMPSQESAALSEQDLAGIVAYCRNLPPVDRELPANTVGPLGRVLRYLDKIPLLSVEAIDHSLPMIAAVDTSGGIAQGQYLAVTCNSCLHSA
jgi:cytochrome c553